MATTTKLDPEMRGVRYRVKKSNQQGEMDTRTLRKDDGSETEGSPKREE